MINWMWGTVFSLEGSSFYYGGRVCIVLKILKDLQEDIFLEEVNDNDDYTAINVYAEYHYLMDCRLEDLRDNIIYGVEPKYQDKICALSKIIYKSNEANILENFNMDIKKRKSPYYW
jgi:hypothetical protein